MVLFMNADDRAERGLAPKARVAVETISGDGVSRRVEGLTVIDYPMPRGSLAGYFPALNPLLPLDHYDPTSGTTAARSEERRVGKEWVSKGRYRGSPV